MQPIPVTSLPSPPPGLLHTLPTGHTGFLTSPQTCQDAGPFSSSLHSLHPLSCPFTTSIYLVVAEDPEPSSLASMTFSSLLS